ncbi:Hypothetical protein PAB1621 [Pyrococcus abyssi GE5]|uniref:Uncharacterized protein n=1 Tax=Pyrococcus abyssi (strain GE5 / Orsay) TaxID=272844 RepID=Q9UZL9_PYRAB|nr:Hypothetical protein PAB1621 [Pyrococcus abyssi GE5]CCE70541.1 TPA: hypothetical protein PAB1621 [Pyrococcus abyssi GE5]
MKGRRKRGLKTSLNNLGKCEPLLHGIYHDFHFIPDLGVGDEDNETLYPCYSISTFSHAFYLYLIPFANLNWSFHPSSFISSKLPLSTFSTVHFQHIHPAWTRHSEECLVRAKCGVTVYKHFYGQKVGKTSPRKPRG